MWYLKSNNSNPTTFCWLQKKKKGNLNRLAGGVPWCLRGLRILHCHCSGSGHCYGMGLIPGPGTSAYLECSQKKNKNKKRKKKKERKEKQSIEYLVLIPQNIMYNGVEYSMVLFSKLFSRKSLKFTRECFFDQLYKNTFKMYLTYFEADSTPFFFHLNSSQV